MLHGLHTRQGWGRLLNSEIKLQKLIYWKTSRYRVDSRSIATGVVNVPLLPLPTSVFSMLWRWLERISAQCPDMEKKSTGKIHEATRCNIHYSSDRRNYLWNLSCNNQSNMTSKAQLLPMSDYSDDQYTLPQINASRFEILSLFPKSLMERNYPRLIFAVYGFSKPIQGKLIQKLPCVVVCHRYY